MNTDINERIQELSACRNSLTEESYERRKICITARLKRVIPAGPKAEILIMKDKQGQIFTEASEIAAVLSAHWQEVFSQKTANQELRGAWLEHVKNISENASRGPAPYV